MTRSFWLPPALAIVAALVLMLAVAGGWSDVTEQRDVGGVDVTERSSVSGTTFSPAGVPLALAAFAGGVVLAAVRGRARKAVGVATALLGIACAVVVVIGLAELLAPTQQGTSTPGPFLALLAAVAVAAAGALAWRGPGRPPPASRYRVEAEKAPDDEWALAADESDDE